jgi:hypothetical protein
LAYVDCGLYLYDNTQVLVGAATEAAMSRKLVWIDLKRFRGFDCSECGWRFKPSGAPEGKSFNEIMRNFELQRDKEFESHVYGRSRCPQESRIAYVTAITRIDQA